MATDMVTGYMYFIESDAVDNQNWVPTVDNIDLATNYTGQEGTEYVKLQIPKNYKVLFNTGIMIKASGAGSSFDERNAARFYQMLANGIETTRINAERIMNFFMLDRHTSGASATYKQVHLVIKYGATSYVKFVDASSTVRDYCKGAVTGGEYDWDESEPLIATIRLNWGSVW